MMKYGDGYRAPAGCGVWRSFEFAAPFFAAAVVLVSACQPTVKVEAPKEPIVINMNVKIEHEIRVKVDNELDALIEQEPELF
jgi:YnbE-like lipoprotein